MKKSVGSEARRDIKASATCVSLVERLICDV